jgi:RNA polymerase sigma-70 factor, ECF subfamily
MGIMGAMKEDWAEIYRTTYEDLVRYLYRKVWDAERAADLAQEAFVRVLHHDADNPRALVFTVATNLARDEARTVIRRRRHLALVRVEVETTSPPPDALDDVEREQQRAAAERALGQLSDRDREVLLLWDAGLSYTDIARQTGLAVGAIGTTLARARRRLVDAHKAGEAKNVARG